MICALIFNEHELIPNLRKQFGDEIKLIDCGSTIPVEGAYKRYEDNLYWAGNWNRFIMELDPIETPYLWMVNSDVEGLSVEMYHKLKNNIYDDTFMVTYSFNSPHFTFHQKKLEWSKIAIKSNWIDMTAPLIDVEKFQILGGFDSQFIGYGADIDLCYRARKERYSMWVNHEHSFHHIGSYSVTKNETWEQNDPNFNEKLCEKWKVNHWTELCQ